MSSTISDIKGELNIVATVTMKPEKVDQAIALLKKQREFSTSDAEPGCLLYEVMRFGNQFVATERYTSAAALEAHVKTEVYTALREADVVESLTAKFYESL